MNWKEFLDGIDLHLKASRSDLAIKAISDLNLSSTPRAWRLMLARSCRRAGLFNSGLRLLTPLIHTKVGLSVSASTAEKAEYAMLLGKLGNNGEALRRLSELKSLELPEIPLFKGFCYMATWEYGKAAIELRRYLEMPIETYAKMVARVNLTACLISLREDEEALGLLEEDIDLCEKRGFRRILANCLELRAQLRIQQRQWELSALDIERAYVLIGPQSTREQLFVEKWKSILSAFNENSLAPLEALRIQAVKIQHWETVRDIDRYSLLIHFEKEKFDHLLFGTPYPFFRNSIFKDLARWPQEFFYSYGSGLEVNLFTGETSGFRCDQLEPKAHLVLDTLMRDFYRPVRAGEMFFALYPDANFDIFSSSNRMRQTMSRVETWLNQNGLPLEIRNENSTYSLKLLGPVSFRVPLYRAAPGIGRVQLQRLYARFGSQSFTANDALKELRLSRPTLMSWIAEQAGSGFIEREFQGRATQYRIRKLEAG